MTDKMRQCEADVLVELLKPDVLAAASYLEARHTPVAVLIGHSLGGAAAIVAASRIANLKALVTLAAPSDAAHVLGNIEGDLEALGQDDPVEVSIGGRPFPITAGFVEEAREANVLGTMERLAVPKLICHSPFDDIVGIDNASRLFQAARHPKSFLSLEQADHLLTGSRDSDWIGDVVAAWSSRHVESAADAVSPPGMGTVKVASLQKGLAVEIDAGRHYWSADEPASVGGTDTGPTPYDLLLGSLGACTAMTIRMVAEREKIPLDTVTVALDHDRNHQTDCDHCDDSSARIEAINRTVSITGEMSAAEREKLHGVAERCPVHRTLTGQLHIHDTTTKATETEEMTVAASIALDVDAARTRQGILAVTSDLTFPATDCIGLRIASGCQPFMLPGDVTRSRWRRATDSR